MDDTTQAGRPSSEHRRAATATTKAAREQLNRWDAADTKEDLIALNIQDAELLRAMATEAGRSDRERALLISASDQLLQAVQIMSVGAA